MSIEQYKDVLLTLQRRFAEIEEERTGLEVRRTELDKEAANVRASIEHLMLLCGIVQEDEGLSGLGFTDAIRRTLGFARKRMSANEIKDALAQKGFDVTAYNNPLASIYTILKRLEKSGEIVVETEGFNVFYKTKRRRLPRHRSPRLPLHKMQSPLVAETEEEKKQEALPSARNTQQG